MRSVRFFLILYFWCCVSAVFAQDIVEVETDIGMDQLKPSADVAKPGIKPRAVYQDPKSDKKNNQAKALDRNPAQDPEKRSLSSATASEAGSQGPLTGQGRDVDENAGREEIESDLLGGNLPVDKKAPVIIKVPDNALTDVQVVEISASFRKLIEENEVMKKELDLLNEQLKTVRGQQRLESNRMNELAIERDALRKQNENIIELGNRAEQSLAQLQSQVAEKERDYNLQIVRLQTELANALRAGSFEEQGPADNVPAKDAASADPLTDQAAGSGPPSRSISVDVASTSGEEELKQKSKNLLVDLDAVSREKEKLTRDEAKLHYNMGNTYYNQGEYKRASEEYSRAVELAPEDANAHYNLAFVNGELLNDPVLAAQHYKKYLFLNPGAEDGEIVRQKIIEAEISIRSDVQFGSRINKEVKQKKNDYIQAVPY